MNTSPTPLVSVIIPVYNDPERLKTCLGALESQTYPADAYEVIVVDNNSEESVEGIVDGFLHAVAVFEGRQGSYAARNRGIRRADGEVLAFTDADCIPQPSWIETGVGRLQAEGDDVGVLGGEIEVTFQDPGAPRPAEIIDDMINFGQRVVCRRKDFSATANLFTLHRVVENVGGFKAHLTSGGDKEFGQRVARHGYRVIFEAEAIVQHPARRTPGALLKKRFRIARGQYDLRVVRRDYTLSALSLDALTDPLSMKGMIPRILRNSRFVSTKDRIRGLVLYVIVELILPFEKIRLWMKGADPREPSCQEKRDH